MNNNDKDGFTLIELLTVISIIAILAGLVLSTASYIQKKAATSRAQAEIKGIEAACESYKADNGIYPIGSGSTGQTASDLLQPAGGSAKYDPSSITSPSYQAACAVLYQAITGDGNDKLISGGTNSQGKFGTCGKCYMELKPNQTGSNSGTYYIVDPFGFSYGYSTAMASTGTNGYNTTFDLWSTAGTTSAKTSGTQAKWIKNW